MSEDRRLDVERGKQGLSNYQRGRYVSKYRTADGRPSIALTELNNIMADVGVDTAISSISNGSTQSDLQENGFNGITYHDYASSRPSKTPSAFEMINMQPVNIPPKAGAQKNSEAYHKTTQTEDERVSVGEFSMGSQEFDYDEYSIDKGEMNFDDSPTHELIKLMPGFRVNPVLDEHEEVQEEHIPELSEDEKRQILQSDDFAAFFVKAGRVMVRELCEMKDTTVDYFDFSSQEKEVTGELLVLNREFTVPAADRAICGMDFSPFHPELFAASYNNSFDGTVIHPGHIHIWNTKFKSLHPEYTYTAPSPITSFKFAPYHSNIIVGGLFTGQVCVWDNRVNKKTPVQRSPLIATAHTQPIYCMNIVGSKNAHDLVTISTDGKMCTWALDNLTAPTESVGLTCKKTRNPGVCTMDFWNTGPSQFAVGTYDGLVCTSERHGKGEMAKHTELHKSIITALNLHKAPGASSEFSNLCLTSSWDWSIKLSDLSMDDCVPLLTFSQHRDVVEDVKWSPVHPAVFASIDCEGQLMVWNLNCDLESPVAIVDIEATGLKLLWNAAGSQLIVGDNKGRVLLYDLHESISKPKSDEWEKMRGIYNQ